MRFRYDQEADALMITVKDGLVARTEEVDNGTLLDLDERGVLLAIEVLRPARSWPLDEIIATHEIDEVDRRALKALLGAERYPFARDPVFA